MKKIRCSDLNDAISKLQKYVDLEWHWRKDKEDRRKWLKSIPLDSYSDSRYRFELWVLEGSPAKAVVVIDHSNKNLYLHDSGLSKQVLFSWNLSRFLK